MNQCEKVLDYISQHGSITTMDAFQHLRITRLPSRICDLRQSGIEIKGEMESGNGTHYMRYSLGDSE